jgi:hypothetical protein
VREKVLCRTPPTVGEEIEVARGGVIFLRGIVGSVASDGRETKVWYTITWSSSEAWPKGTEALGVLKVAQ